MCEFYFISYKKIRMSNKNSNKSRNSHRSKKSQTKFINHWPINEKKKDYDALEDNHATFYFMSDPVQKRLKNLKKVLLF